MNRDITSRPAGGRWPNKRLLGYVRNLAGLWLRLAVLAAALFGPGGALLSTFPAIAPGPADLGLRLGLGLILSSLALGAQQWLAFRLRPQRAKSLDAVWLAACAVLAVLALARGWPMAGIGASQIEAALVAAGLLAVWSALTPLSPYPGNMSLELGDAPGVYQVARNLAEGKGLVEDYFIGEYLGGKYHYVTRQPLLSAVAAFTFRLFGREPTIIQLYS